ncbi:CDP-diacylglycerol--glycerol-3-phosphate 3-phosphatidyltransferase [Vagococcus intermedius]|uniref:CDP-diacylglycerol--glycerol-3-phosphate 3-phosphatidyltransferase n=1 Tax=Vagococcus intermedius TaxID=2991418 RepID=A0AAF0I9H0_9ENTE|nr:CDP-diacylglycerol--glycerol-3-phosphate 3-phosphatidyltransferase [Vagococcus intermedius]WEG73427.1 CDP-diacylglycerol--glycerol-3-phosphate 3-phosphatidyltransferase [Vagococcus intermedius]WEG75510.1 CDP-diacylglycerol--glycerol-3-phosphate 3-phosphatidyltransferase [Vagococcus intermedius]
MNLPNKLTVIRICMIPLFIIVVSEGFDWGVISIAGTLVPLNQLIGMLIFAVASLTDWLDGKIARAQGLVTNFGKFADPLADKMLVMTAFIILVGQGKVASWIVAIIVCRELAVTGLRLLLVEDGEVMAAAWPGKVKTATQMLAIILLMINNAPFEALGFPLAQILLYVCLIFTIYSGVDYFWQNKHVFKGSM